jgi:hypothetical protein
MSTICRPAAADVLLLYPGESLRAQMELWGVQHPEQRVEVSRERSLPEIRRLLRGADAAVVDATDDPCKATDAFLQAVARLGANAVTMYTEGVCDGLELFVRMRGSLFLLGPLLTDQWDDVMESLLRGKRNVPIARTPATQSLRPGHRGRQYVNRLWTMFE